MSRVAKRPLELPKGVELNVSDREVTVKGPKGALAMSLPPDVDLVRAGASWQVELSADQGRSWAFAGTARALLGNMVKGVTQGFERKLELNGVGYRAQAQGRSLNLTLGYSHPLDFKLPDGITAETPSQTEIIIRGTDKQKVGQVAAEIRQLRRVEPYKGKGVRYAGERVVLKEAKKK